MLYLNHLISYQNPVKQVLPNIAEKLALSLGADFIKKRLCLYYKDYPLTTPFYTQVGVIPLALERLFSQVLFSEVVDATLDQVIRKKQKQFPLAAKVALYTKDFFAFLLPHLFSYVLYLPFGITYFSLPSLLVQSALYAIFSQYLLPYSFVSLKETILTRYNEHYPNNDLETGKIRHYMELFYLDRIMLSKTKKPYFPDEFVTSQIFGEVWNYVAHLEKTIALEQLEKGEILLMMLQTIVNTHRVEQTPKMEVPGALFSAIEFLRTIESTWKKRLKEEGETSYTPYFAEKIPMQEPEKRDPYSSPPERPKNISLLQASPLLAKVATSPKKKKKL